MLVPMYLDAWIYAMASPQVQIELIATLPHGNTPRAPAFPSKRTWSEFPAFMSAHGFAREKVRAWYGALRAQEPEVLQHIGLACTYRLRDPLRAAWEDVKDAGYNGDTYMALLAHAGARTHMAPGDLDAWLRWSYRWPQIDESAPKELRRRFHVYRTSDLRVRMQSFLREKTLMHGAPFDELRALAVAHHASAQAMQYDDVVPVASYTSSNNPGLSLLGVGGLTSGAMPGWLLGRASFLQLQGKRG